MNDEDTPKDNWFKAYWRPAMAWQYLVVCVFDFFAAPILTGWYSWLTKIPYEPWKPITMSEGGFYHMAMAAIVGITAFTRGREKIARVESEAVYNDVDDETQRRIEEARRRRRQNLE